MGRKAHKKCLVIRIGALGDGIMASSVFPYIFRDGYKITANVSPRVLTVFKNNPYVSDVIEHDTTIPIEALDEHWKKLSQNYDKVVNLTGTVENNHLFAFGQDGYYKCLAWRRKKSEGINYYENQVRRAGYEPSGPVRGQIYFNAVEKIKGEAWRKHYKKQFVILWALSGSSMHKIYKWYEKVSKYLLKTYEDIVIVTSGDYICKLLTYDHERIVNLPQEERDFRYSMLLAKYADLVVGPETGLLNAAGCFTTPKICFLTHSSKENVTKHWINDYSMQADVSCSPCYILQKYKGIWRRYCQVDELGWPKCNSSPAIDVLIKQIEEIYHGRNRNKKASWKTTH